jgi:hypothetical protein
MTIATAGRIEEKAGSGAKEYPSLTYALAVTEMQ